MKNIYTFYSNLLQKMVVFFISLSIDPQRSFILSRTIMAMDKGTGRSESSGIEIYTMSDIIR